MTSKATESYSSKAAEPQGQDGGMDSALADKIRRRAYDIYLDRGSEDGRDLEDWLQAERELTADKSEVAGE
jgi:hypothetical protein